MLVAIMIREGSDVEQRPPLIVILGPTACGKSGLGIELARTLGGEVVSADSRQVFRGLDLGTGKVTPEEIQGVPHHLLDILEPNESYSAARFQQDAYAAIDGILQRGALPFLVGGTGLYLRAVTEGFCFDDGGAPDPALRARLEHMELPQLVEELRRAADVIPDNLDLQNPRRVVRAIERAYAGAKPRPSDPRYRCLLLGAAYPREVVCRRIDQRLRDRLDAGMVDEVRALRAQGASDGFLDGLGLEYRYTLHYLQGKYSYEEYLDELSRAIKRFAKRQVMWFKRDRDVHWLDMDADPVGQALALIRPFLQQ